VSGAADLKNEVTNTAPDLGRLGWFNYAAGEAVTVLYSNAQSTRVLLLLRCGETDSALNRWSPNPRMQGAINFQPNKPADPYLEFASDWAWAMFDRVICAHMRGDETLALATARQLSEVQPKIEAECAKRGFQRQKDWSSGQPKKELPYLAFLEQLPQILADLERRAREGKRVSVLESGLQTIPQKSARIAALIRDLDLAQARQWEQPGGVDLSDDPIVKALIAEGDAAVDPLIACLEGDQRLTRSVQFRRDFARNRTVLTVNRAAMVSVERILQASFRNVAEVRPYWAKYKGMTLPERCYAILADDSASGRWLEAAGNLIQSENLEGYPAGINLITPVPTNAPESMRGESLRQRTHPSVSELMAKRALENPTQTPTSYDVSSACEMGLRLGIWDRRAALPVATALVKRCCDVMKYSDARMGKYVAQLSIVRAQAGDAKAFDEYAEWLKTTNPTNLDYSILDCLEPFQRYPTNAVLAAAADSLFSNTNSGWTKYPWTSVGFQDPLDTDLVKVSAIARWIAGLLDDKRVCGSIEFHAPNNISYSMSNRQSGSRTVTFPPDERPADGTKTDLRWCDWVAFSLSNAKHVPFFNPIAPVEKRDAAIQNTKRVLTQTQN
jgi:hypothetical protein